MLLSKFLLILIDKTLESESQEENNKNENEKVATRKVESRKEENDDDETMSQNKQKNKIRKGKNDILDENNWQIKIIWRANK